MKVLNYGSLNIDHVYKVNHIVSPGETLSSRELNINAGGKGANQSVAIAKTGIEVWHAGKIGEDGEWLLEELSRRGVKTDLIRIYNGPTGHAIIQVTDQGENSIIVFGGGNNLIYDNEVDETLKHFSTGDYLVLQNEINNTEEIITKAHKKGMKICLNPAPFSRIILSWPLEFIDILILNEIEAMGMVGHKMSFNEMMDDLVKMYPHTEIIITTGKKGAYFGYNSQRVFTPIRDVLVVDTTAAGDTFMGYYIASRMEGICVKEAMNRATLAASLTVSRPGAMDSIPAVEEIKKLNLEIP